jgi:hypothetical protein
MTPAKLGGTMRLTMIMTLALALLDTASAAEPVGPNVELNSERIGVLGLPLAESAKTVHRIGLTAKLDEKGAGSGVLVLDLNGLPAYDEFGFPTSATSVPPVKLDCTLKFVKKKTVTVFPRYRPGAPEHTNRGEDVVWKLYAITGPKITSRLFLAKMVSDSLFGRLLVHGENGKVKYAIDLHLPPQQEPCHPGCFPAGTLIRRPEGTVPIEQVRAGDVITTVGPDGRVSKGRVDTVFTTTNRLIEVRTGAGTLVTTETQPLALVDGGLRAAGELKAGDRIWRWEGRERHSVEIRSVAAAPRVERVFNLILSDSALFVANGFLARSKPPAPPRERTTPEPRHSQ